MFVDLTTTAPIAKLTLNRPEVLNAWHKPMRQELVAHLRELNADPAIRAILITGAGDRAFCAGQDLNEAKDFDAGDAALWIEEWRELYDAVRAASKPVVAALNGVAAGSAFQFALFCDIRIGHQGSRMGQPEINAGIASITGPFIMAEMMGLSRTVEMALTGRLIDGEEAYRIGILHHLVDAADVQARAEAVALELAAKPPGAMALDKAWLREMTQTRFEAAMAAAVRYHERAYASGEPQAQTKAFLSGQRAGG